MVARKILPRLPVINVWTQCSFGGVGENCFAPNCSAFLCMFSVMSCLSKSEFVSV